MSRRGVELIVAFYVTLDVFGGIMVFEWYERSAPQPLFSKYMKKFK